MNIKRLLENKHLTKFNKLSPQLYIGWVLFIAFLTLLPGKALPQIDWNFWSFDKIIHFTVFSIMAFLGCVNFKSSSHINRIIKPILVSLLIAISYGTMLEYIQTFIPERGFDYADLTANFSGAIAGVFLFSFYNTKINKHSS